MKTLNHVAASLGRRIAAALVLAVAFASPSQAVVYSPSPSSPGPTLLPLDSFALTGPRIAPATGFFTDSYFFSLGITSGIGVATARIDIVDTSQITGFTATLFSGATPIAFGSDSGFVAPLQIGNSFVVGSLGAGSYRLEIGGTSAGSSGGSYLGALAVTPAIPEPEVWAMMLVGFGLVVFRVRQRSRKAAALHFA